MCFYGVVLLVISGFGYTADICLLFLKFCTCGGLTSLAGGFEMLVRMLSILG